MKFQTVIVGAGFAGSVIAERLASQRNEKVLIIEQRNHIGGNSYDRLDSHGILIHQYGPHIFHTADKSVWDYLSRFTEWNIYHHEVLTRVDGKLVPMPFNLNTLQMLFPETLSSKIEEKLCLRFGMGKKVPILDLRKEDDADLQLLADYVYEKFFLHYTEKQWGLKPEEISPEVTARVPVFISRDNRYFQDAYQGMPTHGYTSVFEKMLDHPNIKIMLNTDYKEVIEDIQYEKLIFTGMVDYFFDYKYGALPYRALDFTYETYEKELFQEAAVVNYPNDYNFTRITEYKQLTGQKSPNTTIMKEFPRNYTPGKGKEMPYYPIDNAESKALYAKYKQEAEKIPGVHFLGRLAEYRYMNQDQVVASVLKFFEGLK